MKTLIALLLLSVLPSPAREVTLRGTVRNSESGEVLPYVNVFVKGGSRGTSTDAAGRYELNVPSGRTEIAAGSIGFKTATVVVVADTVDVQLNIGLSSTDVILQEVAVYAAAGSGSNDMSSISMQSEEIKEISSVSADVFRSIQSLPGISVNNEFSAKFNVRGGNYDENLVLVNGTQVYEPFHIKEADNVSVGIFNMELMKKVNLITGGFSAQYGDRLSSVLNIEYREGNKEQFAGSATLSLTNFSAVVEGPLFSGGSFVLGARKSYTEYILSLVEVDPVTISFYDVQGVATFALTPTDKLQVKFIHAGDNFAEDAIPTTIGPLTGRSTVDGKAAHHIVNQHYYDWGKAKYFSNLFDVKNSVFLSNDMLLTTSVSYYEQTDNEHDYRYEMYTNSFTIDAVKDRSYFYSSLYESPYDNTLTIRTWEPKITMDVKASPYVEISAGASYIGIRYNQDLVDRDTRTITTNYGSQYPDTAITTLVENKNLFPQHLGTSSYKFAGFVENVIQLSDALLLNAGGRVDYFGINRDLTWSPRLNVSYVIGDDLTARAAWGHYYQSPIYRQLAYSFASDTNTQSQKAEHVILSLEKIFVLGQEHTSMLTMKAEGYYKKYSDIIAAVRSNGGELFYSRKNDSKGYCKGMDLYVSLRAGAYYGWVSYGLLYAKEDLLTDVEGYFPRYSDQRHTLSIVNDIELGRAWSMNLLFNYGSGFAITPRHIRYNAQLRRYEWIEGRKNSEYLPPYKRVDLRLAKHFSLFGVPAYVFAEASNLFNAKNVTAYRYRFDNNGYPYRVDIELFPFIPSVGMNIRF